MSNDSNNLIDRVKVERWVSHNCPFCAFVYRFFKYRIFTPLRRMFVRCFTKIKISHADPYAVYWISPESLKYWIGGLEKDNKRISQNMCGELKGGSWDKESKLTGDLSILEAAKKRFIDGEEWENTKYYKICLGKIKKNHVWRNCRNQEDLNQYLAKFDKLYAKIKSEGYKTQDNINDPLFGGKGIVENEISVNIDRKGEFIFYDGRHRLSIALILGLKEIPVKVCIRHTEWQEFVNELLDYAKKQAGGQLYQPLTHPDLQNIPFKHGHKRFELIKDNLDSFKGDLLDVGANTGYFCSRFEELGYDCYAVEYNQRLAYFLEKLKLAEDRNFKVINKSIFDYKDKKNFDVMLALNIFHHFIKNKNDYDSLMHFLSKMDIKTMFFEPHLTGERVMRGAYRNYKPNEFTKFVMEHASLKKSKLIGISDDGRPLYKLWK